MITFYGAIDLKDLIIARTYVDLETLITQSFPYVRDHETISDCIETVKRLCRGFHTRTE